MSVLQQVFWCLSMLQLFGLVGVLVRRRHYQRMPLFTMYAGGVSVSNAIVGLHYTWETWMVHQVVAAALRRLAPEDQKLVETITAELVGKMLHQPTLELRRLEDT